MPLNEAETRAKLIDPAIKAVGWTEEHIKREETAGRIAILRGKAVRARTGRTDYTLRLVGEKGSQPVAVGIMEAKSEDKHPSYGLEQSKLYARSKLLNTPFVFSTNGHLFIEYDRFTGLTSEARPLSKFPTPGELWSRYEIGMGFKLTDEAAKPLITPYNGSGEQSRRYYQDACIRAIFEKLAKPKADKRALVSIATGGGKTYLAALLLRRFADAGQLRKALFICDRTELRENGAKAMRLAFGSDAAEVKEGNPQKNARVLIATYHTLGIDTDESDPSFLLSHYPENYFSHIIIDECHRSAWGKWSEVLKRNPDAVQIGLTATPRSIKVPKGATAEELANDERMLADNIRHFGEPVYEYDLAQAMEDGYLAACEIRKRDIFLEDMKEAEHHTGISSFQLQDKKLNDPITGRTINVQELEKKYNATRFEALLRLPDRVNALSADLFEQLLTHGGPEQKTVIFCAGDSHADEVANAMNNLVDYKVKLASALLQEAPDLSAFVSQWIDPQQRQELINHLPESGTSAEKIRLVSEMDEYDLYDVLAQIAYQAPARTRLHRVEAFAFANADWLASHGGKTEAVLLALVHQFVESGTDGLELLDLFEVPSVRKAGGLKALEGHDDPKQLLMETKRRLFVA